MDACAIDHVLLAMPPGGEERARAFYVGVLGMTEAPKPATLAANGGAWFRAGTAELHLGVERAFVPARKAHPALRIADLDGSTARCQAAGVAVEWDDRYPGVRRFYVHDPFGNRIELMEAGDAGAAGRHGSALAWPGSASDGTGDPGQGAGTKVDRAEAALLRHFLAAIAYRTQKALRGAPPGFGSFAAGNETRTPAWLVRHMASVMGYARTFFVGGRYVAEALPTLDDEVARLHANIAALAEEIARPQWPDGITPARLLQGPLSDAMTHAGQLAMLRRLAGSPVPPEDFVYADVSAERLGRDQPAPARPDAEWPEAPPGWEPPET